MTMRSLSSITLRVFSLSVISCLLLTGAHAQTRVAYVDATKLLKRIPEAIDAQTRADQLAAGWQREASDLQSDLDRKTAEFERRKLVMTDAERAANDLDVQNTRKRLDDFRHQKFDANGGELFTQQALLMKPAYDRLQAAIKDAALDGGYDYVIDRSSRDVVLLYANSKHDLTLAVARKLGIESEILTTPLINDGPKHPVAPAKPGAAPGAAPGSGSNSQGLTPGNTPLPNPKSQTPPVNLLPPSSPAPGTIPPPPPPPPAPEQGHP